MRLSYGVSLRNGAVFDCTFDGLGNISGYSYGNHAATYGYDDLGQLISATEDGVTTTYTYDTAGNIRQVRHGSTVTGTYTYGNSNWRDLLTAYNNQPIAYEGQTFNGSTVSGSPVSGNPISYFNGTRWEFDWAEGRQLVTATTAPDDNTELSIDYTYDLNGLRTGKTVTTRTYSTHTHNYTNTVVAPTCTTDGYTLHECACGDSYQDSTVSKLGHAYQQVSQSGGTITYRCTRCGHIYYSSEIIIPPQPPTDPPVIASLGDDENTEAAPLTETETGETDSLGEVGDEPSATSTGSGDGRSLISTVTEHHDYIYASGLLLREIITTTAADGTVSTQILDFTYDATGSPYSLTYTNGTSTTGFYYITNLQGDVVSMVNASGDEVAAYTYDPYGKVVSASGTLADRNPLRYRGYYYDEETGFYYLQSRYYDPTLGRFINADSYTSTGQGFIGYNMFSYCGNNPINYVDNTGRWGLAISFFSTVVAALSSPIVAVAAAVVTVVAVAGLVALDIAETNEKCSMPEWDTESVAVENVYITTATEEVATITSAKTKGKERMRDSGLADLTDSEIQQLARDKSLPQSERQRYKTEEKARGLRNRNKRDELY